MDNVSSTVIAMLAAQAADFYELAKALMEAGTLSNYADSVYSLLNNSQEAVCVPFFSHNVLIRAGHSMHKSRQHTGKLLPTTTLRSRSTARTSMETR